MGRNKFGDRLKMVRKWADCSQEDFAKAMGVTPTTILRYEKGSRLPDAPFLKDLITKFNCDVTWLLTGNRKEFDLNSDTNGHNENKDVAKITKWLIENPEAQMFIVKLIHASKEIEDATEGLKHIANKGFKN
ncbi:MAG: hypothetical protein ACD_59C00030G0001 [uncultured bacterium]|nr:MAG: hypothetical protein ACD_59C00030G0001 [uncultured bacterium]